jgi:restriction endonuclease S subunit
MLKKLPKGWVRTTLGEICLPVETIRPEDSPNTKFTYFDIGGIDNESNRVAETKFITGRNAPSRARKVIRKGDILFSTVRTYLRKTARVDRDYTNPVASTGFSVIRPAEGVSSHFLLYQVLSEDFLEPLHKLQSGTSYPAVRERDVLAQQILLPPVREQERIAAKLNALFLRMERGRAAAHRAHERLRRYRAAVLRAAVSGDLTRAWREPQRKNVDVRTETGEALLERLLTEHRLRWETIELQRLRSLGKEPRDDRWKSRYREPSLPIASNLPQLPKSWTWAAVDQVGEVTLGRQRSPQHHRGEFMRPYLRVANVFEDRIDISDVKYMNFTPREYEIYRLQEGDILLNEGQSLEKVGRPAMYRNEVPDCCFQKTLLRFRSSDAVNHHYALVVFRAYLHNGQFKRIAKITTNLAHLTAERFAQLEFPLPPLAEQIEIVREVERRLSAADKLAITLDRQLDLNRATRQSLLHDALAGRLVPQNSKDEHASVLLKRIRAEKTQTELEIRKARSRLDRPSESKSAPMRQPPPSPRTLRAAWQTIGKQPDARRLFDEAGFAPDQVVAFYEALRATPELREAFQETVREKPQRQKPRTDSKDKREQPSGRFRLVQLWLEDFKNLKDYTISFNPSQGLDVVLGWNGTGKSNLFEALVIIFRDLHEWWEKNRWPDRPMNGFCLSYEIDGQTIEVNWRRREMKRPELKKWPISGTKDPKAKQQTIKRDQLPLPRFVFGYYSGPTNRLCEHFLPMQQAHYIRLRQAKADDAKTLAKLLEQRRFFCAETHHAKYVLLAFSYKEDPKISEFLENRLRIMGFESALFVIRKPRWARPGSKPDDFWGATGIMRRVMERLRRYAVAPMVLEQTVSYGYRSTAEDHYYFFLPDLPSLHSFAAEYEDARTFFLALESTDFSELIHDVKIQVRVKATNAEQVPITFHQLSEGEQQLLMVLGLMRFTKSHQSLVLLDEPDTHLNPHWSVSYLKDLTWVMSDNSLQSPEQQSSQTLMATHDPLVIASLMKEQIHLLKRDSTTGACKWTPATVNPRGLGFTGILTSEMFGFRSDLDPETLADLDNRVRLVGKEGSLTTQEEEELKEIDSRLADAGFSKAFSDPYYAAFVRAWGRRHSELMAGEEFLSVEKLEAIDRIAREVLEEAVAEVERKVAG